MSDGAQIFCSACGAEGAGNFCAACGSSLGAAVCGSCGSKLADGALYCGECGKAVGSRAAKPASARVPWVLSAVALLAFSFVLSRLVQSGSVERIGEMTVTGGLPTASGQRSAAAGGTPTGGTSTGMPSLEDLASMTPRQAADRLFERAMREHEGGDFDRAAFFLDMGLKAYVAVPPADIDTDARFHMGLMQLLLGDSTSARLTGADILEQEADNLLGLILSARVADFAGQSERALEFRARLKAAVDGAGGIPSRQEYDSHRPMIERELEGAG